MRDKSFDILKGVAIILVIVGHCDIGGLLPFIDSFHMPLFFFVSGFFLKKRPLIEEIQTSAKRLFVPYVFVVCFICFVELIRDIVSSSFYILEFLRLLPKYLLCVRDDHSPEWLIGDIGILWFLPAMFWGRSLVVLLINNVKSMKIQCVIVAFFVFLGMLLHKYVFVPYCVSQGLFAAGFIYVGFVTNYFDVLNKPKAKCLLPVLILLWIYSSSQGGLSMVCCWFSTECVSGVLGAYGMFFALYLIVKRLSANDLQFFNVISFWGRCCFIVYSVHAIEMNFCNWNAIAKYFMIPFEHFVFFQISTRVAIILTISFALLKIKPLRERIFHIKTI